MKKHIIGMFVLPHHQKSPAVNNSHKFRNSRTIGYHWSRISFISLFLLFSNSVFSETYLVDFSLSSSPGGNWNSLQTSQNNNIALTDDETNSIGAAKISHTFTGDSNVTNGWNVGNVDWLLQVAAEDGFYCGPSGTITFSSLNNGSNYSIDIVAAESPPAFPSVADVKVNGSFANSNRLGTAALGDNWNTDTNGKNNWLTWDNVAPSAGNITITVDASATGYFTVNAIRIRSVGVPNSPPTASAFAVAVTEGDTHIYSTADFSYNDVDGDPLSFLLIETVPDFGTLYVDANNNDLFNAGEQVSNGAMVSKTNLDAGNLQYIQNGATNTSFQFEVNDGTESSSNNYTATMVMAPVAATISNVDVPTANTYINNQNLDFTVHFSKAVDVDQTNGTPSIDLTIGTSAVNAAYQSGTGSSELLFRYTIQTGELDSDGIVVNSLNLNMGNIFSNGNLSADLTLNSVGSTSGVLIDAVAPQLQSVIRFNPTTSPTDADQVTLRYTFSEAVNNVQDGNFFSNNPGVITSINTNPFSSSIYDVDFTGIDLAEYNGSIVFGFITAGVTDAVGNAMSSGNVVGTNDNSYVFENIYFIGGTVTGLIDGNYMVLTNSGGDEEVIIANGGYVFDTPLVHLENYLVEIDLEPINPIQPCEVTNGTSSINSADVLDIDVNCDVGLDLIYRNGFDPVE